MAISTIKRVAILGLALFAKSTQTALAQASTLSSSTAGMTMSSTAGGSTAGGSTGMTSSGSASASSGGAATSSSGAAAAVSSSSAGGGGSAADASICGRYAIALFGDDSAASQTSLISAIVTTAVFGNTTATPAGVNVPGIVAANSPILQYFNGSYAYFPQGGQLIGHNFVGNSTTSKTLLTNLATHLVQWFARDFGCGAYQAKVNYTGNPSMANVHMNMNVNNASMTYFDTQLGLTLASYGVAPADLVTATRYLYSFQKGGYADWAICTASDCSTAVQLNALVTSDPSGGGSSGGATGSSASGGAGGGGMGSSGTSTGAKSSAQNIVPALSAAVAIVVSALALIL